MRFPSIALAPGASQTTPNVGAHGYTPFFLTIYDFLVLYLMNTFVWCCSTSEVLLPFFRGNVRPSKHHLDIGCGSGYFLEHGQLSPDAKFTLCDLNANCLDKANSRLARPANTRCLQHDIFQPLPRDEGTFESISLFYLLHCLPASLSSKSDIIGHLKYNLEPDGVMFGATILGPSGNHTLLSRLALRRLNYLRHMSNMEDTRDGFVKALEENFYEVESREVGSCLLFTASRPRL